MWKYCVIEYKKSASGIVLLDSPFETAPKNVPMNNCWNILYQIEFNPLDESELELAFNACMVWIEQNGVSTSKYCLMEMFIVEKDDKI